LQAADNKGPANIEGVYLQREPKSGQTPELLIITKLNDGRLKESEWCRFGKDANGILLADTFLCFDDHSAILEFDEGRKLFGTTWGTLEPKEPNVVETFDPWDGWRTHKRLDTKDIRVIYLDKKP
jgi:hypothetical protein